MANQIECDWVYRGFIIHRMDNAFQGIIREDFYNCFEIYLNEQNIQFNDAYMEMHLISEMYENKENWEGGESNKKAVGIIHSLLDYELKVE